MYCHICLRYQKEEECEWSSCNLIIKTFKDTQTTLFYNSNDKVINLLPISLNDRETKEEENINLPLDLLNSPSVHSQKVKGIISNLTHALCFYDNENIITSWKSYLDPEEMDIYGHYPFHILIKRFRVNIFKILYEDILHRLPFLVDNKKRSILHLCTIYASYDILNICIPYIVPSMDIYGRSPFYYLMKNSNESLIIQIMDRWLHEHKNESMNLIGSFDKMGIGLMHLASKQGHLNIMDILYRNFNISYDVIDESERSIGMTPLMFCILEGSEVGIINLLNRESSIYQEDRMGRSLLYYIIKSNKDIISILDKHNKLPNSIDSKKSNIWEYIVNVSTSTLDENLIRIIEIYTKRNLISRDVPYHILRKIASIGRVDLWTYINTNFSSSINPSDRKGCALAYACLYKQMNVVKRIIEEDKVQIFEKDYLGNTILHYACMPRPELITQIEILKGSKSVMEEENCPNLLLIEFLLNKGTHLKMNITNSNGVTPDQILRESLCDYDKQIHRGVMGKLRNFLG